LSHADSSAARQGFREQAPNQRFFIGIVDLVAADAPADPRLGNALGIAQRDAFVLESE